MVDRHAILQFFREQPANVIANLTRKNAEKNCDCQICVETRAMLKMLEQERSAHAF